MDESTNASDDVACSTAVPYVKHNGRKKTKPPKIPFGQYDTSTFNEKEYDFSPTSYVSPEEREYNYQEHQQLRLEREVDELCVWLHKNPVKAWVVIVASVFTGLVITPYLLFLLITWAFDSQTGYSFDAWITMMCVLVFGYFYTTES
jgi:hypothetical protein